LERVAAGVGVDPIGRRGAVRDEGGGRLAAVGVPGTGRGRWGHGYVVGAGGDVSRKRERLLYEGKPPQTTFQKKIQKKRKSTQSNLGADLRIADKPEKNIMIESNAVTDPFIIKAVSCF